MNFSEIDQVTPIAMLKSILPLLFSLSALSSQAQEDKPAQAFPVQVGKDFTVTRLPALQDTTRQTPAVVATPKSQKQWRQHTRNRIQAIDKHKDAMILHPDGTSTHIPSGQNVTIRVNPDGTHASIHKHGQVAIIVNPDGTHTIVPLID